MAFPAVAVIGAGYAGLACAVELARAGVHVTVFERSTILGGRARLVNKGRDWPIDNGQHILIGAYHELTRLLRLTGCSAKALSQLPLTLHVPGELQLQAAALPAPFNLAWGLLRARGLSLADRLALPRLLRWLKARNFALDEMMTVREMLHAAAQTARLSTLVWEPLCLAALNTPPAQASAQVFANVLRDSLLGSARDSELLLPRIDLSELFPVPAARYLAVRRGKLRTGNAITALHHHQGDFTLDGDPGSQPWRQVVIATAAPHAARLLHSTGQCAQLADEIAALPHEPITSVYLALDPDLRLPAAMIGLSSDQTDNQTDAPAQWAFDRAQLGGPAGLIACVISAWQPEPGQSHEDLVAIVHAQLERQLAPQLGRSLGSLRWSQVIVEKRATIACHPGLKRPDIHTPLPGLWLAGDYLASPYPATLESAVRSGTRCAQAVLETLGQPG